MLINTNSHMHVPILTMLRDVCYNDNLIYSALIRAPGCGFTGWPDPKESVNIAGVVVSLGVCRAAAVRR